MAHTRSRTHISHQDGRHKLSGNPHGEETPCKTQSIKTITVAIRAETACAQQCARKHPPQATPGEPSWGRNPAQKHNHKTIVSELSRRQIKAETACAQQCARKHPPQATPGEHQQTSPDGPDSRTSRQDYSLPGRALAEQVYLAVRQMIGQSPCQTHL